MAAADLETFDSVGRRIVGTCTKAQYERDREDDPVHVVVPQPCTYGGDW